MTSDIGGDDDDDGGGVCMGEHEVVLMLILCHYVPCDCVCIQNAIDLRKLNHCYIYHLFVHGVRRMCVCMLVCAMCGYLNIFLCVCI